MERLEADLAGAADDPTATAAAAPAPAASRRDSVRGSAAPHAALAQQLQKHLTSLEALRAAAASAGASGPALERRLEACSAAQAQLERACAAQLAELRREEQQAAAEFEAAAQSIQDMQTAQPPPPQQPGAPRPAGQHNSAAAGCGATPPSASSDLPPEVTACDAFMQRHGPTGVLPGHSPFRRVIQCGSLADHLVALALLPSGPLLSASEFRPWPPLLTCPCMWTRELRVGGWHPDDHAEFLRILRACRGSLPHCLQLCAHELGLLHGPEDVAAHAR